MLTILTMLTLLTPAQLCHEAGILAEQLQRRHQYGTSIMYDPAILYNASGNEQTGREYVDSMIRLAVAQPVERNELAKLSAVYAFKFQVLTICHRNRPNPA